jgi:hypothetical protein
VEKSWSQRFAALHGDHRGAPIGVAEKHVAATLANDLEPGTLESADNCRAG